MMMMFGGVCDNAAEAYRMMDYAMKLIGACADRDYDDDWDEGEDEDEGDECYYRYSHGKY